MGDASGRPVIYCGNFEYEATERDVLRLFGRYGRVERVDMKSGFAFVYMRDRRAAEDAIRDLDRREWGYRRPRALTVEFAKKHQKTNQHIPPARRLFVVNFDERRTGARDLEDVFARYGRLRGVEMRRNFAFVEFDSLDDAIAAQRKTHQMQLQGRTITVEFVQGNNRDRGGGGGDGGGRGRSRSRSRSPAARRRRRSASYDRGRGGRGRDGTSPPPRRGGGGSRSPPRRAESPPRRRRSRSRDEGGYRDRMDEDGEDGGGGSGGSGGRSPQGRRRDDDRSRSR